ncbi:MAG: hypothetical protein Q8M08_17425 [Bacteroidales bacterium]|nr:hypothetical protein [Bacteroidales bacterium]
MIQNFVLIVGLIFSAIALLGGLVTVWVNTNVKIAKLETTVTLKIAAIEMSMAAYIKTNSENLCASFAANKEDHHQFSLDMKELRTSIHTIDLNIQSLAK